MSKISQKSKPFFGKRVYREKCSVFTPRVMEWRGISLLTFSIYPAGLHNSRTFPQICCMWDIGDIKCAIYPADE